MTRDLDTVLDRALREEDLTHKDVELILAAKDDESVNRIFQCAKTIKERHFGNVIFTYGFVYYSTYCRNNCTFCYYRRDNNALPRYRISKDEIVTLSRELERAGVNMVDLTMGEDPDFRNNGFGKLLDTISDVREAIDIPIMVSPGALPRDVFPQIKENGADWFACYQETHNRDLFGRMRIEQDYDYRLNQKYWASSNGLLTEEGIMTGVGESIDDRSTSILNMRDPRIQQVRAMTYVPQDGAPLKGTPGHTTFDELMTIATLRITNPDKLIPASMDVEGLGGLIPRIFAGANVVTSIVPPRKSLMGVAQHDLDIDNGNRSIDTVKETLKSIGCRTGTNSEYRSTLCRLKDRMGATV